MTTNYVEYHQHLEEGLARLGQDLPGPMSGFARLHRKSIEDGALSRKVKEMMAVAISIVVGCEGCIAYHVHDAVEAGATRAELLGSCQCRLDDGWWTGLDLCHPCPGSYRPISR